MTAGGATTKLAEWVSGVGQAHTPAARAIALDGVRDVLGVILAGAGEETPCRVAAAVRRWGAGDAAILGTAERLAPPWAALVNGTAAHVLDYDDTFTPLNGHATAVLVPAILALAEEVQATGAAVLDALIVGLEVMARVGEAVNPRHYALGWHATSTIGAVGAASACARLLRLPAVQVRDALSLGVSMAGGTRMQLGAMAKSFHAGMAAKAGVMAATLAAEGVGGAEEALEGPWRFVEMYAGRPAPAGALAPPAPGQPLAIEAHGINFKPYPTCAATHFSLDALLALKAREGFAAEAVESIETSVPLVLSRNLMHPRPTTGMEARFSMEYCLAAAAVQGRLGPADFEGEAIHRPVVRALMPRIVMQGVPEADGQPSPATSVTVRLRDGRVLTETPSARRGTAAKPMSAAEHEEKFRSCARVALDGAAADVALRAIAALDGPAPVTALIAALTPGAKRQVAA